MKSTTKLQFSILILSLSIVIAFFAYFTYAAPSQTSTSWKDNFTDQSGIAALSNINFSTGNLSLNNSPWFYPNHDYRKQIKINGSTSNLSDYQVPINITAAIYNNTGLVGSWHFTSNSTEDSSGYGNNGAQNGGVNCTADGKFGGGCGFDGGTNTYVSIPLTLMNAPAGTIDFWFKPAVTLQAGSTYYGMLVKRLDANNDYRSIYYYDGALRFRFISSGGQTTLSYTTTFNADSWYHVAAKWDDTTTTLTLYINGNAQSITYTGTASSTASGYAWIGNMYDTPSNRPFNGTIDEVRIYNRSLSATEIAEQYQAGKARLDYQDLRFTWLNATSNTEQNISHWLETDNQAWVKVPNVTASTVANTSLYLYYGNPSATYNNSLGGNSTFEFFDDFSGDLSKWDIAAGSGGTIVSGKLQFTGVGKQAMRTKSTIYNSFLDNILEFSVVDGTDITAPWEPYVRDDGTYAYMFQFRDDTNLLYFVKIGVGNLPPVGGVSYSDAANIERNIKYVTYNSGGTAYLEGWIDNIQKITSSDAASLPAGRIRIGAQDPSLSKFDNLRVRKYASPEPNALSIGAEQNKPRSGSVGSVQIIPTNFGSWGTFSVDSLLGWQYKKEINISNTAGNLTNYQVNVLLINGTNFNSSKAKANGDDIRFTAPLSYSGNGKWLYKKEINISNRQNPSTLTDYQVLIPLEGVGGTGYNFDFSKAKSDGSDIRFYDPDTKSELSYWIESWNSTTLKANVWVKIPSIAGNSDKRIWMWYGNPSATYNNSLGGRNTFGDSFDLNKYTKNDPNNALTNTSTRATMTSETNGLSRSYITLQSPLTDFSVDFEAYFTTMVANSGVYLLLANSTAESGNAGFNGVGVRMANTPYFIPAKIESGNKYEGSGAAGVSLSTLYYVTYTRVGTTGTLNVFSDATRKINVGGTPLTYTVSGSAYNIFHVINNDERYAGTRTIYIQNVRLRKYSSVEPNITVSSSEFSINSSHVEVPYWLESWNASTNSSLWVKAPFLQNGTNTTVYMYYGNAEAASAASGANTFEFFDDFSGGSLDLSKWAVNTGNPAIVGGKLQIQGEAEQVRSISSFSPGIVLTMKQKSDSTSVNHHIGLSDGTGSGYDDAWSIPAINNAIFWSKYNLQFYGTRKSNTLYQIISGQTNDVIENKYTFLWTSSDIVYYKNDVIVTSTTDTAKIPTTALKIQIDNANDRPTTESLIDDIRVRKYASPEPNTTVSATDTSGDFSAGVADINYKIMRNAGLADWKYRKAITINGSTTNLTDYQIPINLTTAIYNNTGLVGSWHFNEGTGNRTADSSGFGNDGTMYGNMNTTLDANLTSGRVSAGKFGNALRFDGANDYVQNSSTLTGIPAGNSNRTIEAWIKPNVVSGSQAIVSYGTMSATNWFHFYLSGNKLSFSGNAADTTGTATLSAGNWYHATIVYNGTNILFYLNGVFDATAALSLNTINGNLYIGSKSDGDYFNGTIDEVRIYNRSLSAAEIQEQYQAGKARLDYQDLRFTWLNTTSSAEQNISHWLESDNQAWVKVPNVTASSVANTTLYMYYGNPSATYNNTLGGNNTFEFFDDFNRPDSATVGNGWTGGSGVSIDTNRFKIVGEFSAYKPYSFSNTNITVSSIVTITSSVGAGEGTGVLILGGTGTIYLVQTGFGWTYDPGSAALDLQDNGATDATQSFTVTFGEKYNLEYIVFSDYSTEVRMWQVGTARPSTATKTSTSQTPTAAGTNIRAGGTGGNGFIDDIQIRKYASPEPNALSIGAEQNNTLCSGITAEQARTGYSIAGCAGNVTPLSLYAVPETSDPTLATPRLRQWNVTWLLGTITITIQSPANTTYSSGSIWFNITLDQQGSWAGYSLNGAPNATLANSTGSWNNLNSTMSDGQHYVIFYANNSGGAMSNSSTIYFTVSLPPMITIQSPQNRTYDRQWVWANATLNKAGSWCGVSLNGAANQTLANTTGKWWLNLSVPSAGTSSAIFYCNSTLGAMNQSEAVFFTTAVIGNVTINLAVHLGAAFADDSKQATANDICISDNSGWFGLTSEHPVSARSGNLSADYNINVSFTSNNTAFLALGKGSCANFRNRAADAQLERFLSPLMAFSYAKTNLIQLILQFNATDITTDSHWGKGTYLLSARNEGYNATSGKQNLGIRVVK